MNNKKLDKKCELDSSNMIPGMFWVIRIWENSSNP